MLLKYDSRLLKFLIAETYGGRDVLSDEAMYTIILLALQMICSYSTVLCNKGT